MSHKIMKHKNFESDTVHGHNTHLAEKNMHSVIDKENQSHSENANKLCDEYEKREMQKEKENIVKKAEYREYLLKQMLDKEKKSSPQDMSRINTFSEEFLNANEKICLKLQKQKEAKQDLDECIKMKQDLKLKTQRTEIEEEQKRSEFWKKRDDENIHILEKAKQESERKEHTKNEVALLWVEEKRKDIRRETFVNSLLEKDSIIDLNKHQKELLEVQKSIRMKKELLKENEEKIDQWMKNLEFIRDIQEKLKKDIEQEEESEKSLKLKSDAMQNSLNKKNPSIADEVDQPKKILQERNYQCANNRFFGIE